MNIAIIGAGLAGLTAAYELHTLSAEAGAVDDLKVDVYEACLLYTSPSPRD